MIVMPSDSKIEQLVQQCNSIRQVIKESGFTYTGGRYMLFKRAIERLNLPTDHFIFKARTYTPDDLKWAVKTSICITDVVKKLNLMPGGANRRTVMEQIKKLNIDTSHLKHHRSLNQGTPLKDLLVENSKVKNFGDLKKRIIEEFSWEHKCQNPKCGITHWCGELAPLELDHKNGNRKDNRIENLWLICANCHRMTPTWGGKKLKYLASLTLSVQPMSVNNP